LVTLKNASPCRWLAISNTGDTMEWYRTNNIDFISKIHNPPYCPKLRPIEEYCSIIKGILRKSGGAAKDINSMRLGWNSASDKVSLEFVQKLMATINRRVRSFVKLTNKQT